jgi:ankyrin repeat protein
MVGPLSGMVAIGLFVSAAFVSPSVSDRLPAAVRAGDSAKVRQLLAAGADVNARDLLGGTPLLDAVLAGNLEITKLLLAGGADVNVRRDGTGSTALEYAVAASRPSVVRTLLDAKARVDIRYKNGQTVLHEAAAKGNREIEAIAKSNREIVVALIEAGAPVNAVDDNGNTPLDDAVLHGQADAVAALLAHGAGIEHVHSADGRGPLHEAAIKGYARLAQPLYDAGAKLTQRDRSGQTPLDLALAYKNGPMVSVLLRLGVSKDTAAISAEAMETATLRGRTEIVRLLIDNGFDVNRPTAAGSTYLNDASLKGQSKIVALLLARGARIEAWSEDGEGPLHEAALGGSAEVTTLLLDHGAAIDAPDRESGATPLMIAASLGRTNVVAVLLRRGANPALRDHAGHTALDRALKAENSEVVKLLEKG